MNGAQDLHEMLSDLAPFLAEAPYVFTKTDVLTEGLVNQSFACVKEAEAYTFIMEQKVADFFKLPYHYLAAKITIQVHSALDAVGLTAALATQLANHNMSCNVVAGFYHDHLFVNYEHGSRAVEVLLALSDKYQ